MKMYASFQKALRLVMTAVLALAMISCIDDTKWQSMESVVVRHNLTGFASQADFVAYAKKAAIQRMRAEVEVNRRWEVTWLQGDVYRSNSGGDIAMEDATVPVADMDESADGAGSAAPEHSETNTQEEGVDEADVVKTDGNYIYALHEGELVIVSALDGVMEKVSALDVGGYAKEMFIYGDAAVVFSMRNQAEVPDEIHYTLREELDPIKDTGDGMAEPDIDYGNDMYCDMYGCGMYSFTQMTIIDISDRAMPVALRTVTYAADYVTSRMVDGKVRLVIDSTIPVLDTRWDYGNNANFDSLSGINDAYLNVIETNETFYNTLTANDIVPKKWDSATETASFIMAPDQIFAPETPNGIGLQTVVSVDLESPLSDSWQAGIFSERGIVYASRESLYLTSARDWVSLAMESGLWAGQENQTTGIHKFAISAENSNIAYEATGTVDGRLLDQFCMGEKDGYLRVATTTGDFWWEDESKNTLDNHIFVLQQRSAALAQVGHLGGLGEGEEIYAARFVGDRGFLVTFFQTDPLYTIDLSNPIAPTAVGEWQGPGYSTYLHPFGENLIISMGQEDWQAAISLYNISEFSNPTLVQRFFLGESEWTSALYEHKAFTFNSETGYLAIPYSNWGTQFDTGIRTFNVSEAGIAATDRLSFFDAAVEDYEAEAQRSMYIGDYMYGMSRCRLASASIATPSVAVDTVALFDGEFCEDYYYYYY
ncbi:MAG: beta-propeller domain-containing protein [Deltaproteobacteria bacterium]|nr:beta-propeller domain-containing protein [Deltaproteobacteria bacterium]MBN2674311.1 beta-propeller domain-containing protein [Deltaproteobacteria bacterium]